MQHKNEQLYDKSKSFVVAALNLLNQGLSKGEAVPWSLIEHVSQTDETLHFSLHPKLQFSGLVYGHREEVAKIPEYQLCHDAMLEHPTIKKFHSSEALREILIDFLSEVVDEGGTLAFDPKNFERVYGRIENDLLSEKNHFTAVAPLCNFDFDGEEIHLGRGLIIRKATARDLEDLCGRRTTRGALLLEFPDGLAFTKYVLQITYAIPKLSSIEPATERLGEVITALRLFRSGGVGFSHVAQKFPLTVWSGAKVTQRRRQSEYAPEWGNHYRMRKMKLKCLWTSGTRSKGSTGIYAKSL
jgi:hypothetical protein